MAKNTSMRSGTLQIYPRVRAKKFLPRIKWKLLDKKTPGLLGFIGYKVGMKSAFVKDNTPHSLTKGQKIAIPATIIECPPMKILSVRFYEKNNLIKELLNVNLDKQLKRKIKISKKTDEKILEKLDKIIKEIKFSDIRIIVYSQVKKTGIKKTPDITEIGLSGNLKEKLEFLKENISKELSLKSFFNESIIDVRGVTKGKGFQGPTKRFGLSLRSHKSEKGVRGPGSGGPWHPARVDFTIPMAGQMGFSTRVNYNNKIILLESIKNKDINSQNGFRHFGKIKTEYLIINSSVSGPSKRPFVLTVTLRKTKKQTKKNYEFIELR